MGCFPGAHKVPKALGCAAPGFLGCCWSYDILEEPQAH